MSVLSPTQQADAILAAQQSVFAARHTARIAGIAREIGRDPVRLASTLRGASSEHLIALCEELIRQRFNVPVQEALSIITNYAARDEA